MLPSLIWAAAAVITALGIALDMRGLRVNRVGLSLVGWLVVSACMGPVAGLAYLHQRPVARRELVTAVWALVGDSAVPVHVRRERLVGLRSNGTVGLPIYRACQSALDAQEACDVIHAPGDRATRE